MLDIVSYIILCSLYCRPIANKDIIRSSLHAKLESNVLCLMQDSLQKHQSSILPRYNPVTLPSTLGHRITFALRNTYPWTTSECRSTHCVLIPCTQTSSNFQSSFLDHSQAIPIPNLPLPAVDKSPMLAVSTLNLPWNPFDPLSSLLSQIPPNAASPLPYHLSDSPAISCCASSLGHRPLLLLDPQISGRILSSA